MSVAVALKDSDILIGDLFAIRGRLQGVVDGAFKPDAASLAGLKIQMIDSSVVRVHHHAAMRG
ncbi:hypothetical protein APY04_1403 [Hyphomicrobium sulfonivorans]|uniref:Uncharacterized protein n=1 Tax=Hyphomicrobium sulfonivorans TaxID=121290 RepID=A0A109BIV8_HYPSL|nr:hypothetical protein [Hyphomicrobium sulfonivorans]KWT69320.1 hypothetical protein APY04_1403 [Hyphomicrobium sulfonivorans]